MARSLVIPVLLLLLAGTAHASPVSGGAGFDYTSGPKGQTTKAGVAFATVSLLGADVIVAGARYDDNQIGNGVSGIGSVGLPLSPATKLRVTGTRSIGDDTYRGWRLKAGPEWSLPGGPTLGLFYTHASDNTPATSNFASGELDIPLHSVFSAQGSLTYGSLPDGLHTTQAGFGLRVSPSKRFLLSGELDVGRNVIGGIEGTIPGGGSGHVHSSGDSMRSSTGSTGAPSSDLAAALLLGFRVLIP